MRSSPFPTQQELLGKEGSSFGDQAGLWGSPPSAEERRAVAGPAAGSRQQLGLGSCGPESFSLSVFTWLGNLALLYFLSETFTSAGLKVGEWGLCHAGSEESLSWPGWSLPLWISQKQGIGLCDLCRSARRVAFGVSCQKEIS